MASCVELHFTSYWNKGGYLLGMKNFRKQKKNSDIPTELWMKDDWRLFTIIKMVTNWEVGWPHSWKLKITEKKLAFFFLAIRVAKVQKLYNSLCYYEKWATLCFAGMYAKMKFGIVLK